MSEDPEYQRRIAEENYWDTFAEDAEAPPPVERAAPLFLTAPERRKIAASLDMTMTLQRVLGDAHGALETVLLRAKLLNGLEE